MNWRLTALQYIASLREDEVDDFIAEARMINKEVRPTEKPIKVLRYGINHVYDWERQFVLGQLSIYEGYIDNGKHNLQIELEQYIYEADVSNPRWVSKKDTKQFSELERLPDENLTLIGNNKAWTTLQSTKSQESNET